jgi:hypothetical protein
VTGNCYIIGRISKPRINGKIFRDELVPRTEVLGQPQVALKGRAPKAFAKAGHKRRIFHAPKKKEKINFFSKNA